MAHDLLVRIPKDCILTPERESEIKTITGAINLIREEYEQLERPIVTYYSERCKSLERAFFMIITTLYPELEKPMRDYYDQKKPLDFLKDVKAKENKGQKNPLIPSQQKKQLIQIYQNKLVDYKDFLIETLCQFSSVSSTEERPKSPILDESVNKKPSNMAYFFMSTPSRQLKQNNQRFFVELLNKAEQYDILLRGRPDTLTLTPLSVHNQDDFVMQWDKQLPPFTAETIRELKQIKASDHNDTFLWFSKMPMHVRVYLHLTQANSLPEHYFSDINMLLSEWNEQGENLVLTTDIVKIAEGRDLPSWFKDLKVASHKLFLTILAQEKIPNIHEKLSDIKKALTQLTAQQYKDLATIKQLPLWFLLLEDTEQLLLRHVLKLVEPTSISFIPTRLRTLLGVANFTEHNTAILNKNFELIEKFTPRLRSSHLGSRLVQKWPVYLVNMYTARNYEQVAACAAPIYPNAAAVFWQTLISPSRFFDTINVLKEDFFLDNQRKMVVEANAHAKPTLLSTNHPLNDAQYILATDEGCLNFIEYVKEWLKNNHDAEVKTWVAEIERLLNRGSVSLSCVDGSAPELELSSTENLIAMKMGMAVVGGCVSGKDRKNIELLFTTARYVYFAKYSHWCDFNNSESYNNFAHIFAALYLSWHGHVHAGQSAPGSCGIKHPYKYLPKRLRREIDKAFPGLLRADNLFATNNEVRNIKKTNMELDILPSFEQITAKFTHSQRKEFLELLTEIVQHPFWKTQAASFMGGRPRGIITLKQLLEGSEDLPQEELIQGCLSVITQRPQTTAKRKEATIKFYNLIDALCGQDIKHDLINKTIAELTAFKQNYLTKTVEFTPPSWTNC